MNDFSPPPAGSADPQSSDPQSSDPHAANRAGFCAQCGGETPALQEARQARMLKRLAEIVLASAENLEERSAAEAAMARTIAAQAANGVISAAEAGELMTKSGKRADDIARSLTNVSRALRLTLLLESKLAEARATRRAAAPIDEIKRKTALAEERRQRQRDEIRRIMAEAIRAEAADRNELNHRTGLLRERLDQDDISLIIGKRSTEEIVAKICRDLGLNPDWRRWHHETWMIEPEFEARPGPSHCPACCPACAPAARPEAGMATDYPAAAIPAAATGTAAPVDGSAGTGPP